MSTDIGRTAGQKAQRIHWAWVVAAVSFVAILGAAGFRSIPGVMMNPLHHEFGWTHGTVGLAMSVNMMLYGLTAPFAAALMDRFGVRPVLTVSLLLITTGSALSITMTASWQLVLLWGVLVGIGTGSISMGFVATIATRWFEQRRGLVTGVLTAASATGQLIFLPIVAAVTTHHGWRWASLIVAAAALAVVPLVAVFMRNYPADKGLAPYGAGEAQAAAPVVPASSFAAAFDGLRLGARSRAFWLLAASFAICGMTTNGLIATHFIPAANDHGMPTTVAAGLLATIGILDVAGTVFSGWLTDRVDPRVRVILDVKTPDSGEVHANVWENLDRLRPADEVKFVLGSRADFDWAVEVVRRHDLTGRAPVLMSAVFGKVEPADLAAWVLETGLPIRLQVQLHKILWDPKARGV